MRITDDQRAAITRVIGAAVQGQAVLFLYGSRVDDNLHGGDIDLLLIAPAAIAARINAELHHLLARLKEALGDQRIDLTVATEDELLADPFLKATRRIELQRW